ncbi:MAG: ATP-binding protein [Bacteroidetes bacterium]|nr:MAG: ATP-binding protein [Bacteroidota bacterium]
MNNQPNKIGIVIDSSPNNIIVEINSQEIFEENKNDLQIGKYLKIACGNLDFIITSIKNLRATEIINNENKPLFKFIINSFPIGSLIEGKKFDKGNISLPVPTEPVFIIDSESLKIIFSSSEGFNFPMGHLVQNKSQELKIAGNNFFSKHIAVVGTTGSGKSCTVAKIIQEAVGINNGINTNKAFQKNSHIIILDLHSEYKSAFSLDQKQEFSLNVLEVGNLKLPYWLMNAEELETMFIESNESNSHNQISQFRRAVILNKGYHNEEIRDKVTYDTPIYFSIKEVFRYIYNLNISTKDAKTGELKIKIKDSNFPDIIEYQLFGDIEFEEKQTAKINNGQFAGEFDRFVLRFDTKINDKRLSFILDPQKQDGSYYKTDDFEKIMKQFIGYLNKANISIIDLSGVPHEVLNITVSLISRLIFDFCFHYSRIRNKNYDLNDIPFMIVCEEAHNYIPRSQESKYKSSKEAVERIAKEGRKYGLSLMIVSQRPSEVSETIFSQCNNFITLRLSNSNDQSYVKSLIPETTSGIIDNLPNLSLGEFIIMGDASLFPCIVYLEKPNPEPSSQSVKVYDEWKEDWKTPAFDEIIKHWKKEI